MGMEVTGKVYGVFETKQISDRFSKREFVLEIADNPKYIQLVMFQATGDRCAMLDGVKVGDELRVEFSLRGREWRSPSGELKYFNTLDVWKIEAKSAAPSKPASAPSSTSTPAPASDTAAGSEDDCPF